jgi:hypothetical protein
LKAIHRADIIERAGEAPGRFSAGADWFQRTVTGISASTEVVRTAYRRKLDPLAQMKSCQL